MRVHVFVRKLNPGIPPPPLRLTWFDICRVCRFRTAADALSLLYRNKNMRKNKHITWHSEACIRFLHVQEPVIRVRENVIPDVFTLFNSVAAQSLTYLLLLGISTCTFLVGLILETHVPDRHVLGTTSYYDCITFHSSTILYYLV